MFPYLREVLKRFKYQLGGGSLLVILAGIVEHAMANSISWTFYIWVLAACFVGTLIIHGADQHKALQPCMKIHHLKSRSWHDPHILPGVEYYFEVFNAGKGHSIEDVHVELVRMLPDPIHYLPVHRHLKHDNKPPGSTEFVYATAFTLNPEGGRDIDLLTGPIPGSAHQMIVPHIVRSDMTAIPHGKYRLFVKATAKNTPATEAVFEALVSDDGALQCVQL